jgi:hypothetical protein
MAGYLHIGRARKKTYAYFSSRVDMDPEFLEKYSNLGLQEENFFSYRRYVVDDDYIEKSGKSNNSW